MSSNDKKTEAELKKLALLKSNNKMSELYEEVFSRSGNAGLLVLYDILNILKFFSFTDSGADVIVLKNAALMILERWGKWDPKQQLMLIEKLIDIEPRKYKIQE